MGRQKQGHRFGPRLATALAALVAAHTAPANATLFTQTVWGVGTVPDWTVQNGRGVTNSTLVDGGTAGGVTFSTYASSQMAPDGTVSFHANTAITSTDSTFTTGLAESGGIAGLFDTMMISSSTQSGTGHLRFSFGYDGILSGSTDMGLLTEDAFGVACPSMGCQGDTLIRISPLVQLTSNNSGLPVAGSILLGDIAFTYNIPFDVTVYLVINSYFSGPLHSKFTGTTDFDNTATLGPIAIFDDAGNQDFTARITSQVSGAIYAVAVPEPTTWAMLIVGFGGLGLLMRRRRLAIA